MSNSEHGPLTPENVLMFFEEQTGVRFIDAKTQQPVMDMIRASASKELPKKSDYELWLEEQDASVKAELKMGEL